MSRRDEIAFWVVVVAAILLATLSPYVLALRRAGVL